MNNPSGAEQSYKRGEGENNTGDHPARQNPSYPPLVEQYRAGSGSADRPVAADRSRDRYSDAGNPPDRRQGYGNTADRYSDNRGGAPALASNGQEPGPFMADPSSAPKALSQTADRGRDRNSGGNAGISAQEGFANGEATGQPGSKQLEGAKLRK